MLNLINKQEDEPGHLDAILPPFAVEKIETLIKHLGAYLKKPAEVEALWMKGKYKI